MKKIFLSLLGLTLLASASFAGVNPVTVSGSTGADGSYATLKAAFDALNANATQGGNAITVTTQSDTTETASAVLNQPSVSSWTSLAIVPNGTRSISGSIAGPLIDLNGADNVTINGTGGLTIDNSNATATASTIRFIADATNNTVQNCNIKGPAPPLPSERFSFHRYNDREHGQCYQQQQHHVVRCESAGERDLFVGNQRRRRQ